MLFVLFRCLFESCIFRWPWLPFTLADFHFRELCGEWMVNRACRIYSERDLPITLIQMECTHLVESGTVRTCLYIIVASPTAKAIPHFLYGRWNIMRSPIGISVVCHNTTQPLIFLIFVFDWRLHPVVTVKIDCDTALVKQSRTIERCLYCERKELVGGFHLQHWSIVVAESIIGALPQVCVRFWNDCNQRVRDSVLFGLTNSKQVFSHKWL